MFQFWLCWGNIWVELAVQWNASFITILPSLTMVCCDSYGPYLNFFMTSDESSGPASVRNCIALTTDTENDFGTLLWGTVFVLYSRGMCQNYSFGALKSVTTEESLDYYQNLFFNSFFLSSPLFPTITK